MKARFFSTIRLLALSLLTLLPLQMHASGFIIIDPFPIPHRPKPLQIKQHDVDVSIDKQVATTTVSQEFYNPNNRVLEGTYIFPVPQDVSIQDFTLQVNDKTYTAKVLNKDKARNYYETIVRKHKDPALLEYVGKRLVKVRIYPIQAKSSIHISFAYTQLLKADDGSIKYCHALGANKSTKYINNASIRVHIMAEKNIVNLYSPTHELSIFKSGRKKAKVSCTEKNIGSSRDFILYYATAQTEIGCNVLTYKEGAEDGFFLAMMSPNVSKKAAKNIVGKNIIFVIDTSGSMSGKKIQQAKETLQFCLQNLNKQDHFNIIRFSSDVSAYKTELVQANHNQIQQALSYVDTLRATGCTNIDGALKKALYQLPESNNPNMIIFLTDGQANVGESRTTHIIANANTRNKANARIFSFGVGYDVNTTLLDKISLGNKGTSDYVRPSENLENVISKFYKKIAHPVLTDLQLQVSGTTIKEIYPINLPDLFHGSQLLVLGRYTNGGKITLTLSGNQNNVEKKYIFSPTFTKHNTRNDFLPRLWASRKIAHLIDNIVLEGKNQDMVDEIITLSKKYGIITQYTSFLVDANAQAFSQDNYAETMKDSVLENLCYAAKDVVGQGSFTRAKNQECLRKSTTVCTDYTTDKQSSTTQKIRTVRARTFYLKDNIWIDADHTDKSPITRIKAFSKAYFDLLQKYPDMGTYLALGKNVILKTDTGSIEIYGDKKKT